MKALLLVVSLAVVSLISAQPSFVGPVPSPAMAPSEEVRLAQYRARIDEAVTWRASLAPPGELIKDVATICAKLVLEQDADLCSRSVIELMKSPGTGPFWMFPTVSLAYLGREQLSPDAQRAIREAWRTTPQLRGDTENHFVMYYTSLYLMAELYPDDPPESWSTGKSSAENRAEAREFLLHWMDLTTTVGQGEYTPTHYLGEYAIPMLNLANWSSDPAMRQRGRMMLDYLFAELATTTLNGVMRGANSRSDDISVTERWNALTSYFSWQLFGNTPPTQSYGGWGIYFAASAEGYVLPEVIYRLAVDRRQDYVQRNLKRTRRMWRFSDQLSPPIYTTSYVRRDYAVGSYQGGVSDPIQTHVWDVTWAVPDPRGQHNTIFSLHPHSSSRVMQMFFTTYPEPMIKGVTFEAKPSYDSPDKILGCSPYEQVFQDLDTVIALYDIPAGERFPHINGFFSKDLTEVTEAASGWIFARGGNTYLAYRPLAPYEWQPYRKYLSMWGEAPRTDLGDRLLYSPHRQNGTIVQAASADEFPNLQAFQAAIEALPLTYQLAPVPAVRMTTLRGREVSFTYGEAPRVGGEPLNYGAWKLFEGPHLNAERGSRRLTITHGQLERELDFNTLTVVDRVRPPASE